MTLETGRREDLTFSILLLLNSQEKNFEKK